jgi:hypothetical protein
MNCYTSPDNLITFSPDKKVVNLLRKRVVSLTGISSGVEETIIKIAIGISQVMKKSSK